MKLFEWIKNIFRSSKVKKLKAPDIEITEKNEESSKKYIEDVKEMKVVKEADGTKEAKSNYVFFGNINESNSKSKTEKVVSILKSIGCTDENLVSRRDYEDLDTYNFKENIKSLTQFDVSKVELAIALSQNPNLIYMDNTTLNTAISKLRKAINDDSVVKKIIYNNSLVLTENIDNALNNVFAIFAENEIPEENGRYILEDNPNIISMDQGRLRESLKIIKEIFKSKNEYIEKITENPNIIGIVDKNLIYSKI